MQLMRRYDLVPQLVEAVKAYAGYEKAILTTVTELRARSAAATQLSDKAAIEDEMQVGLHHLMVLAEDYPDLKASENFLALQEDLTEIEDYLQYSRRFYNGAVRILNTRIESFPHLLIAKFFGFRKAEFFAASGTDVRSAPEIELS